MCLTEIKSHEWSTYREHHDYIYAYDYVYICFGFLLSSVLVCTVVVFVFFFVIIFSRLSVKLYFHCLQMYLFFYIFLHIQYASFLIVLCQ